ncbi:hypothetical protein E5288_WYG011088 [Bos mutus]|uniref:Urotensin-2B n=1 Tax=Bos mutus TaxID=72004 RepID=A0A6B0RJX3_9CETA|nr:hypothetical protein [Bos mutus]
MMSFHIKSKAKKDIQVTQIEKSFHYTEVIITGNELLPDKEDADGEEPLLALLNKNFGFQRPSNIDIELADKLEELNQLEKLKEQLMEAKDAEMSYAIDGLSSSHPNKRGLSLTAVKKRFLPWKRMKQHSLDT